MCIVCEKDNKDKLFWNCMECKRRIHQKCGTKYLEKEDLEEVKKKPEEFCCDECECGYGSAQTYGENVNEKQAVENNEKQTLEENDDPLLIDNRKDEHKEDGKQVAENNEIQLYRMMTICLTITMMMRKRMI